MSDNIENLILLHLRDIRAGQDRLEDDMKEVKHRLLGVERSITLLRRDDLDTAESVVLQQATIDRITERINRIERRLELSE